MAAILDAMPELEEQVLSDLTADGAIPDSRCVVQRRFLIELTERAVAIELDAALDKCGGAKARIVHDSMTTAAS